MIRRIRRTLPWFGAVVALLMLALPVQADEMEPEPYVEEEVEPDPYVEEEVESEPEVEEEAEAEIAAEPGHYESLIFDAMVLRPLQFARLVVGVPFFIFYPFTIASGYDEDVVELLWTEPFEATFYRPLGEVPSDY
ncbi:MAG: hypothetical protein IH885_10015 [Myxococcales bacterium]|nr:hypothetical protein [Myxococcales bacterium]